MKLETKISGFNYLLLGGTVIRSGNAKRIALAFATVTLTCGAIMAVPAVADAGSGGQPALIGYGGSSPVWSWDSLPDSSTYTQSSLASLISELKGTPAVVGAYLDYHTSPVLTSSAVSALHNDGIAIDLIEDSYTTAEQNSGGLETSAEGAADATTAATEAHNDLGAPENYSIIIYRDIERGENVSSAYITGWYNQLGNYHFIPGFYENPTSGQFSGAFCTTTSTIEAGSALWSAVPSENPSQLSQYYDGNQPTWNPSVPYCASSGSSDYAWQYILAGSVGPVDNDLMSESGAW